jgi:hypothetical protein
MDTWLKSWPRPDITQLLDSSIFSTGSAGVERRCDIKLRGDVTACVVFFLVSTIVGMLILLPSGPLAS